MTREEAVRKLVERKHCNEAQANYELDALEILGVVQFDKPKTPKERLYFLLDMCAGSVGAKWFLDEVKKAGLSIHLTKGLTNTDPNPTSYIWRSDEPVIRWARVNNDPFEYCIQQGRFGDEFVKLLDGSCLRRRWVGA